MDLNIAGHTDIVLTLVQKLMYPTEGRWYSSLQQGDENAKSDVLHSAEI